MLLVLSSVVDIGFRACVPKHPVWTAVSFDGHRPNTVYMARCKEGRMLCVIHSTDTSEESGFLSMLRGDWPGKNEKCEGWG